MKEYHFTNDWFGVARNMWPSLIKHLPDNKSFLEIGSWEGRATVWIAENMAAEMDAMITCVDTWQGGEEHDPNEMGGVFARFSANMSALADNQKERGENILIRAIRNTSVAGLAELIHEDRTFDFVYIDGSHIARDVLIDACMSWPMLKNGGVMVFDDYMWAGSPLLLHRPKPAIDAFTSIFGQELLLLHNGYQVAIQKVKP